ncbi:CatA-like O-acetyltransferase [Mucilaginibacter celer]|uniref:Chloramphenicol acetyltransferase n=1 Tax=Mucilaginibacter celer TaxID=2305508 RepID=A0A494W0X3_9SPHI|nr:CatA-like O-acetyltransferase [Mucilaginibacter celer]AYL99450.1 chloramphenicol acetyltransferase [Mucilaginibacter celer]
MKQQVDINNWIRKEHYNFFKTFEEPYYGVNVDIDVTAAYKFVKQNGISFFLYTMYQSLAASQIIEAFRYRMEGDEVFIYDRIDGESTVPRANGTFGFGSFQFYPSFEDFNTEAIREITRVQSNNLLELSTVNNTIRYSSLPWLNFTALSHARKFSFVDSCPKISFGKMTDRHGKRIMPLSIHVNHALVDGIHLGQYIDCYQDLLNKGV